MSDDLILLALGSNLPSSYGTPAQTLSAAAAALVRKNIRPSRCSRVWLTAPVPASDQPWYHNQVMAVHTDLAPQSLLSCLLEIEKEFGRVRTAVDEARTLDIDILAYGDHIINTSTLTMPHPRLHERAFVLYPLREIAPRWSHPVSGKTVTQMADELPSGQELKPLEI